jgi:mono/diheme cytochrome c family protein
MAQKTDDKGKLIGKKMFEEKCSKCHMLERAHGKKKSMEEWKATVDKMRTKNHDLFTDEEVSEIIWYLGSKSTFETKCSKCHGYDRPLSKTKSKEGWQKTVERMKTKDPEWINPEEADMITGYLFTVQGE